MVPYKSFFLKPQCILFSSQKETFLKAKNKYREKTLRVMKLLLKKDQDFTSFIPFDKYFVQKKLFQNSSTFVELNRKEHIT